MNVRPMLVANAVLIAAMSALSVWAWNTIPDGARVPAHWGLNGPDRFADKSELVIAMPAVALVVTLLMWAIPHLDPRRDNVQASAKFWNIVPILVVALLAYTHVLMVLTATGYRFDMLTALVPGLSLMMMGIGNYLGKTRSNWFGGVRTPWTLSSDYSWQKTHHWAGRGYVLSGLVTLVVWLVDTKIALAVFIAAILATSLGAVVMSYIFWRADPERAPNGTSG